MQEGIDLRTRKGTIVHSTKEIPENKDDTEPNYAPENKRISPSPGVDHSNERVESRHGSWKRKHSSGFVAETQETRVAKQTNDTIHTCSNACNISSLLSES